METKINIRPVFDYYYHLEEGTMIFLSAVVLHAGGEINRDRLLSMLKKANACSDIFGKKTAETNVGVRNLYHWKSKNLNKFFNDESLVYIYRELISDLKTSKQFEFTIEELLVYVNLMLNKNRNYCIDYLYHNVFSRLLNASQYCFNSVNLPIKLQDIDDFDVTGYCCDDCDGDYEQYKAYRYEYHVVKLAKDDLKNYFISLKRYKVTDPKVMQKINEKNRNLYR
jgi:hypothetical protein